MRKEIGKAFQISLNSETAVQIVIIKWCSENIQNIYRRKSTPKCDFNNVACNFIKITLRRGCSPLNLLYIFGITLPKTTSVSREINFKKWKKIGLSHDKNIAVTYLFTIDQVIIIKI